MNDQPVIPAAFEEAANQIQATIAAFERVGEALHRQVVPSLRAIVEATGQLEAYARGRYQAAGCPYGDDQAGFLQWLDEMNGLIR